MNVFKSCGIMFDMSRDGVMKVDALKKYIKVVSQMGIDTIYLYLEDTYELKDYPMFGYMRGRYSHEELKEIDTFCTSLEMKMIPCIQTLGHMAQYLKYSCAKPVRDTANELLCGADETYELIEAMVKTMRECISGDKLHIGMDEALDLGTGQYYLLHGYEDKSEIFLKHLNRVCEICYKYGFKPMIWDDVAATLIKKNDEKNLANILPDVELVPWGYGCCQTENVQRRVDSLRPFNRSMTFAGTAWTYGTALPRYKICKATNLVTARGAAECGVENYIMTLWGDDGCPCNYGFALPQIMELGFYNLNGRIPTDEELCELAEKYGIIDYRFSKTVEYFDQPKGIDTDVGKRIVWGDLLYNSARVFDKDYAEILANAAKNVDEFIKKNDKWQPFYKYAKLYIKIASIKANITTNIREAYLKGNREFMTEVCETLLPEVKAFFKELELLHRKMWLDTYKPFGYQKTCCRYGAQIMRLSYTIDRIRDYLDGKIPNIPELEAEPMKCLLENEMKFITEDGGIFIDYEKWSCARDYMDISL